MPRRPPRAHLVAVGATAVGVLLGGLAVVGLRASDSATVLTDDDAVAAFRSPSALPEASALLPQPSPSGPLPSASPAAVPSAAARASGAPAARAAAPAPSPTARTAPSTAPAAARGGPPPGVYRYATEGFEEVDALGGSRHDYPETSTVSSSPRGCGSEERWQPLRERIGVTAQCPGARGLELRATFQQREFFGQSQSQTLLCDPGVLVLPKDPRPGQTWSGTCRSDDTTAALAGRVVALEQLVVEGTSVPVVRVRLDGTLTGATRGESDRELWLRRDGLLVQVTGTTDTDADTSAGEVRYRETYRLRLLSLTPLQ